MHVAEELDLNRSMIILSDRKCLVVEDSEINQHLFSYALTHAGMIVSIVSDGEKAIDYIKREGEPDIIIMDLNMPVMDGYEAASFIRRQLHLAVPIIAMTATSFKEEKDRCIEAGMNDYLTKPLDFDDLYKRMARLITDRSSAAPDSQPAD